MGKRSAVFHALPCDPRIRRSALGHVPAAAAAVAEKVLSRAAARIRRQAEKAAVGHKSRPSARKARSRSGGSAPVVSFADRERRRIGTERRERSAVLPRSRKASREIVGRGRSTPG
jgi:hypothetical protein